MSRRDADAPSTSGSHPTAPTPPSHFYQLPYAKEKKLKEMYKRLDIDGDGRIDIKDLTTALKTKIPGLTDSARANYARKIIQTADRSNSSDTADDIDFGDFVHYILEREKKLLLVFKDVDKNADGLVDVREIQNYFKSLGVELQAAEAQRILDKMDSNRSTTVDLDEFRNFLMFYPSDDPRELILFWRHHMVIDIGEDSLVPEDFTQVELVTGAWWRHLVAGGMAGCVSRTCTAPLDRLKVFLQVSSAAQTNTAVGIIGNLNVTPDHKAPRFGLASGMKYLLDEGGVKSLWRGNGVNVVKIAPETALKFTAYEQVKKWIKGSSTAELTIYERFLAGSIAGSFAQTCIYPMEVLKTRLALRKTGELNRGLSYAAVAIYRREGLRAFYRGYLPNLLGIIPYAGIDLAIYETLKSAYIKSHKDAGTVDPGVFVLLACGTSSSTCGQLASYPLSLVRTRLQARAIIPGKVPSEADHMLGQFKIILQNEGFFGLYRGITPNFMKVLPSVGISYVVYETVRKHLGVEMT